MIFAGAILIAGELAVGAERDGMKPVAIGVDMVFGDVFVPVNVVVFTKVFGFLPSFGLDADELDIASVGVFIEESVAEFVKELERARVVCVIEGGWRGKLRPWAGRDGEVGVIRGDFSGERF